MSERSAGEQGRGDRKQIGLPPRASELLDEIVAETPWFGQPLDVYRLAIGVALARDLRPSRDESESYETKYGTSSVDPSGEVRDLILALAPECDGRPYDYAQRLANKGVLFLHSELVKKGQPLTRVIVAREDRQPADA
jgi:hypothetical protein